jgi:hypothetical protein
MGLVVSWTGRSGIRLLSLIETASIQRRSAPNSRGINECAWRQSCRWTFLEISGASVGPMPCSRCLLSGRLSVSPRGRTDNAFSRRAGHASISTLDVRTGRCNGELLSTGESITRLRTSWKHRCGMCGHEDWADATYPRVAYLPIDAIGPDDSYT